MTPAEIGRIVGDAQWLAHRYDSEHDAFHFRNVSRDAHRRVTFLIDDYLGAEANPVIIARGDAVAARPPQAPLHFIVHSAFCCSTLLARAFDLPGVAMGLKEPVILNDITGWRHRGGGKPADIARALDHALVMLARPFKPGEAVIVKPSNVTNGVVRAMLALRPDARALLLHAPLDTYLKSVAKKGLDGRLWVRDLMAKFVREGLIDLGLQGEDYLRLTDLQSAAVGWLAQHALFARLASEFGDRVRTLDSEDLLARPGAAIGALGALYALNLDEAAVSAIVAGPAFTRHSKTGDSFGSSARAAEYDAALAAHKDEIGKVLVWANVVADAAGVSMTLPSPLLG